MKTLAIIAILLSLSLPVFADETEDLNRQTSV